SCRLRLSACPTIGFAVLVFGLGAQPGRAGEGKAGKVAKPVKVTLEPAEVVLGGARSRQQLLVTGHYADGSVRDLTLGATFQTDRPDRVRLAGSVVWGGSDGQARI